MGASRVLVHVVNESGCRAPLHPPAEAILPVVDRPIVFVRFNLSGAAIGTDRRAIRHPLHYVCLQPYSSVHTSAMSRWFKPEVRWRTNASIDGRKHAVQMKGMRRRDGERRCSNGWKDSERRKIQ